MPEITTTIHFATKSSKMNRADIFLFFRNLANFALPRPSTGGRQKITTTIHFATKSSKMNRADFSFIFPQPHFTYSTMPEITTTIHFATQSSKMSREIFYFPRNLILPTQRCPKSQRRLILLLRAASK